MELLGKKNFYLEKMFANIEFYLILLVSRLTDFHIMRQKSLKSQNTESTEAARSQKPVNESNKALVY